MLLKNNVYFATPGDLIMVHSCVFQGRYTPRKILSISNESSPTLRYSTSVSNDLAQCFPSRTGELNEPCQNSCSPVSVEEVSSKFDRGNIETSHLNRMDRSESYNQLLLPELNQALRKLKEQLSLDDDDEDNFVSPKKELLPHCNLNVETHDLQHLNYEIKNSQDETLQNPLDEFKQMSDGHFDEDGMQYDDMLNNSGMCCCLIYCMRLEKFLFVKVEFLFLVLDEFNKGKQLYTKMFIKV